MKNSVNFIAKIEQALVTEANRQGLHGVVRGHARRASIRDFGNLKYINCGHGVESCTASDGELQLIRWSPTSAVAHLAGKAPDLELADLSRATTRLVALEGDPGASLAPIFSLASQSGHWGTGRFGKSDPVHKLTATVELQWWCSEGLRCGGLTHDRFQRCPRARKARA